MVWRDDLHDAPDKIPNGDRVGVGIDHDNHRGFLRGKVVGVRLVARDISVVPYPAELVFDSKPIQRTVTFRRGGLKLLAFALSCRRKQLAGGQISCPDVQIVDRREQFRSAEPRVGLVSWKPRSWMGCEIS
jgi:hypothetical protein